MGTHKQKHTQNSPVALYTHVLRYEEVFETMFKLISGARIKGNAYVVRRANFEYTCIYVHMHIP